MSHVFLHAEGTANHCGNAKFLKHAEIADHDSPISHGDVFLTHTEFEPADSEAVLRARERGAITVQISDGILEWRNTFEHPPRDQEGLGAILHHPVFSDFFLATGDAQRRIVESWGNPGKCHSLGCPRMEEEVRRHADRQWNRGYPPTRTLLIASARKFSIGPIDATQMIEAYRDLRSFLATANDNLPYRLEPRWRVPENLGIEIGLSSSEMATGAGPLSDVLAQADIILTSQSTLLLEAMLQRKPTVCIDYTPAPHYVRAAWNIRNSQHFLQTFLDLAIIGEHQIAFQETELADQLNLEGSSTARLEEFVDHLLCGQRVRTPVPKKNPRPAESKDAVLAEKDAIIAQLRLAMRLERELSNTRVSYMHSDLRRLETLQSEIQSLKTALHSLQSAKSDSERAFKKERKELATRLRLCEKERDALGVRSERTLIRRLQRSMLKRLGKP